MKQFKASVPLFVDLKNEAIRDRHWRELMKKTGQKVAVAVQPSSLHGDIRKWLKLSTDRPAWVVTKIPQSTGTLKQFVNQFWSKSVT